MNTDIAAGPDLDAEIYRLLGNDPRFTLWPEYSRDYAAMGQLIDEMRRRGWFAEMCQTIDRSMQWQANFCLWTNLDASSPDRAVVAYAGTLPHAVALAALQALQDA